MRAGMGDELQDEVEITALSTGGRRNTSDRTQTGGGG